MNRNFYIGMGMGLMVGGIAAMAMRPKKSGVKSVAGRTLKTMGEVADAVAQLPGVADVKVLGVPHEVLGEEVAAAIVLKKGETFDADDAKQALAGKLAKYKIPAYFVVMDGFPLLGSGKIDAITLKKTVLSKLNNNKKK